MFCNFCGAPNPDVAAFCNKCGKPLARTVAAPAAQPVAPPVQAQPITRVAEVTPAAMSGAAVAPISSVPIEAPRAVAPVSSAAQLSGVPRAGALSPEARTEFRNGLTAEVNRQIEGKCIPAMLAAWIFTLVIVARFTITWFGTQAGLGIAVVAAFASAGGIVSPFVKSRLENKYLRPIADLSDEMLVNRYNEAKADRRAAGTRTAISWAVIAIIVFVLIIAWVAAQRH